MPRTRSGCARKSPTRGHPVNYPQQTVLRGGRPLMLRGAGEEGTHKTSPVQPSWHGAAAVLPGSLASFTGFQVGQTPTACTPLPWELPPTRDSSAWQGGSHSSPVGGTGAPLLHGSRDLRFPPRNVQVGRVNQEQKRCVLVVGKPSMLRKRILLPRGNEAREGWGPLLGGGSEGDRIPLLKRAPCSLLSPLHLATSPSTVHLADATSPPFSPLHGNRCALCA